MTSDSSSGLSTRLPRSLPRIEFTPRPEDEERRVHDRAGRRVSVLYLTYDGLLEPLGQSQVVSYLLLLAESFDITVISFEKGTDLDQPEEVAKMGIALRQAGIAWAPRRYHKHPLFVSTLYDVLVAVIVSAVHARRHQPQVVHARSYVPALAAFMLSRLLSVRFLFDMRGFWLDEKVDEGAWSRASLIYRLGKRLERRFVMEADAIVSLTHRGLATLKTLGYRSKPGAVLEVIPTCADLSRFSPRPPLSDLRGALGLEGRLVIGSVGSMTGWYLRAEMLKYLSFLVRELPAVTVLFVTREDHSVVREDAARYGIADDRLVLTSARYEQMPDFVRLFDLAVFFVRPGLSKAGSAPTKLGEFLACGVPVVVNPGYGDVETIIRDYRAGVVVEEMTDACFEQSLPLIREILADPGVTARCRVAAESNFALDSGAARYQSIYERLTRR